MTDVSCTLVVPTIGRPSLTVLLAALAAARGPRPAALVVVDDRRDGPGPDLAGRPGLPATTVLRSSGRGPAAARNLGWRAARTAWVAFLDDDVVPHSDWFAALARDLAGAGSEVAGVQGVVHVPLPAGRRPTDWERVTAGLGQSHWITADMAYRRDALAAVGGFDERFRRAFREDADLALRVLGRGGALTVGQRRVDHPVRAAGPWVSVRSQAGNADDVLMHRLHGAGWRERAGAPRGRRARHRAVTAAGGAALALAAAGRRRTAVVAAAAWSAGTAEFALARWWPGPRDRRETAVLAVTSAVIPPVASWQHARGLLRHRRTRAWTGVPELVLFDRDGTLVHDVPYNGDPGLVRATPFARESCDRLRAAGARVGVVSNQSGIARGLLTPEQVAAVNARVESLLGPFDSVQVCPHGAGDGCSCRKPAPGMVKEACAALGVDPSRCVVVGDIGVDVGAATAAGARSILVPTPVTRADEVATAPVVRPDLRAATDLLLSGTW